MHLSWEDHWVPLEDAICGIRITVSIPGLQPGDVGSIPVFRTNLIVKIMDSKIEEKEQMTLYIGGNMIVLDKSKDVVKKSNCPEFF